jgi:hypothetical protein
MSELRGVVLQASANPDEVAVFLYEGGRLRGPVAFSTLGMRIQNEQSGSSSLYAQPLALEAVPEDREQGTGNREQETTEGQSGRVAEWPFDSAQGRLQDKAAAKAARTMLEARMESVLAELMKPMEAPNATVRQGHLALLKRWYYRPEVKRPGEICFPSDDGSWPVRAMLRSVGRIAAKALTAAEAS